jgi:hypothetical protein
MPEQHAGGIVVKHTFLVLAAIATLGVTASPNTGLAISAAGFETLSTFMTGAVLLLLATAARRTSARKE